MNEKKLYAVMNKRGKLWDFNDEDGFYYEDEAGCPLADNKEKADKVAELFDASTMVLTNGKVEKEGVTEEEASLLSSIKNNLYKSNTLAIYNYLNPKGNDQSVTKALEKHLMRALINGYTVKDKQYFVYKVLPGKTKGITLVQAVKVAGHIKYVMHTGSTVPKKFDNDGLFTNKEISEYGLEDLRKQPVED